MEFDKRKVYTALNADELKLGSKVICANTLVSLKSKVREGDEITEIKEILEENNERRFRTEFSGLWPLVYLVSEPEETWIVYVHRRGVNGPYLTSCRSDRWGIVQKDYGAKTKLFEGTDDESVEWYTSRRHLADVIAAWEDGKAIQYNSGNGWEDCCDNRPAWDITSEYRIKPEGLKWTDLKIGDIITNSKETFMIIGIDTIGNYDCHILAGDMWIKDTELKNWEKVE